MTPAKWKQTLDAADVYLRDAADDQLSPHTRYSAAMNALGCLLRAGIAPGEDHERVEHWEAARYDLETWPTAEEAEALIKYVQHVRGRASRGP